jgi:hypothetical protein
MKIKHKERSRMSATDSDKRKKGKCLNHPAMECPTPNEPCIFTKIRKNTEKS